MNSSLKNDDEVDMIGENFNIVIYDIIKEHSKNNHVHLATCKERYSHSQKLHYDSVRVPAIIKVADTSSYV